MLETVGLLCLLPLVTSQPSIVVTLDTSKSMQMENRAESVGLALFEWFEHIPDEVLVGIVAFNTDEEILSDLTTSRNLLRDKFPYEFDGQTCIGCGVQAALQVLGEQARHGVILLITDGENTEPGGYISDVQDEVVESGAKVVAVGIGDEAPAEGLQKLAKATSGLYFSVMSDRQRDLLHPLNQALQLAQYLVNPTTTTEYSVTNKTMTMKTNDTRHNQDMTTLNKKPASRPETPYWLIVGIVAAGLGALLLVIIVLMLVWRQLFVPQTNGFYQVAYSDRDHKTRTNIV